MRANVVLGVLVLVFCVLGLVVGVTRLAPGRSAAELALAVAAGIVGVGVFVAVVRVGRRGVPHGARWLVPLVLLGALFVDRLPEALQLALLALGIGYVAAFVATIVIRIARLKT
jgi:hypothetical protein